MGRFRKKWRVSILGYDMKGLDWCLRGGVKSVVETRESEESG